MYALFAATYPERTSALIMVGTLRRLWAPDFPWGETPEEREHFIEQCRRDWGTERSAGHASPSLAHDRRFRDWWSTYLRMSASPGAATALVQMNMEIDIRHILPAIRVPTLIIHRMGDRSIPVEGSRFGGAHSTPATWNCRVTITSILSAIRTRSWTRSSTSPASARR